MTVDHTFLIKRFNRFPQIFTLMSKATSLPFAECDPDTFADQVYVFAREEDLQEYARRFVKEHYLLEGVQIPRERYENFFRQLHMMGIDTVCIVDEGAPIAVSLSELAPKIELLPVPDPSIPEKNQGFMLTSVYFLQELRKPSDERGEEEMRHLMELEEEMAKNLMESKFIVSFDTTDVEGTWNPKVNNENVKIPFVKNKKDELYQPIFSDFTEFAKLDIAKRRQISLMAIDFAELPSFLASGAKAFALNPNSINLLLTREQITEMISRYQQEEI